MKFGEISEYGTHPLPWPTSMSSAQLAHTVSCSLEQAVKDDVKFLAESPYLASKKTPAKLHGFLYDIKTGACQRIEG
jgi:carbonic anhydrase